MRVIELSKGYVAVISAKDFRRVNRYKWYVHFSAGSKRKVGKPYARGKVKGKMVYLHRFIMDAPDGMPVDHLNHCTLDCRDTNLEIVTTQENLKRRRTKNGKKIKNNTA